MEAAGWLSLNLGSRAMGLASPLPAPAPRCCEAWPGKAVLNYKACNTQAGPGLMRRWNRGHETARSSLALVLEVTLPCVSVQFLHFASLVPFVPFPLVLSLALFA